MKFEKLLLPLGIASEYSYNGNASETTTNPFFQSAPLKVEICIDWDYLSTLYELQQPEQLSQYSEGYGLDSRGSIPAKGKIRVFLSVIRSVQIDSEAQGQLYLYYTSC